MQWPGRKQPEIHLGLEAAVPAPIAASRRHRLVEHYGGWSPSRPDQRDLRADIGGLEVAAEVDPRLDPFMPTIWDQGQLGSCTANAVGAALQYNHGVVHGVKARRPSRLDIYYGERSLEGSLGQGDTGAFGRDGFKFAQQTGYLLEAEWPYDIGAYQAQPPPGARIKLTQPYAVVTRSVGAWKAVLSNRQTIAFGFSVYESFESAGVERTGIVPMPLQSEQQLGGHEVLAVGYLSAYPDYVLARNSWGPAWGLAGYCLMPWAYILTPGLSSDFRTIVRSAP